MAKKNRKAQAPTPPAIPKWIESLPDKSPQEIQKATNARLAFRALRRASGLTQPELAHKLGVSLAAVQGAESGYKPVGREMAKLVQIKLGVFSSSVTGLTKEPLTLLGERVSAESIKRATEWQARSISDSDLKRFTKPLELLIRAAVSTGRLRLFGAAYKDMLWELKKALDLDDSLRSVLNRQSPAPTKREISRKELRESPELAKALQLLGIVDDPSRPDEETIETTIGVKAEHHSWFAPSPLFPDWNNFVDPQGNIRWADHTPRAEGDQN